MRFIAVLNREGGTLRTTDLDAFTGYVEKTLADAGHTVEVRLTSSKDVVAALNKAAGEKGVDVVMAGGGDGTISAAAAALMNRKKALAILPAGTMNLFARGLAIPLKLEDAVAAFADGEVKRVDMATANDRPFVHQYSIGMHAKLVKLRSKMEFGSRLGKMRASAKAALSTITAPPSMNVTLRMGESEMFVRTSGIGVTNNLFGEGHLPYADEPDGGTLGIYVATARTLPQHLGFVLGMARGKWKDNQNVEIHETDEVTIKVSTLGKRRRCVIDGELCKMDEVTTIRIHPRVLRVLVPAA